MSGLPVAVIGPVERGSIVLVDQRVVPPSDRNDVDEFIDSFVSQLKEKVGHDRFLIACMPFVGGATPVKVFGPDDLKAMLGLVKAPA